jgi:hypothetical protein
MTIPFKNRRRCNAADSESAMSVLPAFSKGHAKPVA